MSARAGIWWIVWTLVLLVGCGEAERRQIAGDEAAKPQTTEPEAPAAKPEVRVADLDDPPTPVEPPSTGSSDESASAEAAIVPLSPIDSTPLGTLRGRVTDEGASLSHANVVLSDGKGGSWGMATDEEGEFRLAAPPGEYKLKVLYLGYVPFEQDVAIQADDHADVREIALEPTVAKELQEFVVEGNAIMVQVKDTEMVQRIGSFTDYAIDTVEDAVGKQAGIATRDGQLKVRGGRRGPLSFRIKGNPVGDQQLRGRIQVDRDTEIWVITKVPGPTPAPRSENTPPSGALMAVADSALGSPARDIPLPVKHTEVNAEILGWISTVGVTQHYHNPFEQTIEAVYVFPLPHDAAVTDFVMTVGQRRIRGLIREREEAEVVYAEAKRQGYTASLLSQQRPNVFRQKVANIEPGHRVDIEIEYFHTAPYVDGWYEFVFPMVVAPRFNPPGWTQGIDPVPRGQTAGSAQETVVSYLAPDERSGHDIALTVNVDAGVSIEEIVSRNHAVRRAWSEDRHNVEVQLSPLDTVPNKDFVLRWRVEGDKTKTAVLTHRDDRGGFFTMGIYPPADLNNLETSPVEFVFVLDCSGSMRGQPIQVAKDAMRRALRKLEPKDTFQLIRFSSSASQLGTEPMAATAKNVERGLALVESLQGSGGTHMLKGIQAALRFPHDPKRLRIVSFMTDGHIGNESQIFQAIRDDLGDARIFSFGVGSAPNRHLLEGMARLGNGAVAYVPLDGSGIQAVDHFYDRVRHPALRNVTVNWGRMRVQDVYPRKLKDIFIGRPLMLMGRFTGRGRPTTVRIKGEVGGLGHTITMKVDLNDPTHSHRGVPAVWARRKIMDLEDSGSVEAVRDFAMEYGLVSDYTSFVAVDSSSRREGDTVATVPVAVPVPEGMSYETTVGPR